MKTRYYNPECPECRRFMRKQAGKIIDAATACAIILSIAFGIAMVFSVMSYGQYKTAQVKAACAVAEKPEN